MLTTEITTLNQVRLEQDLTWRALGKAIGISGPALLQFVRGRTTPHERSLYKIRRFLDANKAPKRRRA